MNSGTRPGEQPGPVKGTEFSPVSPHHNHMVEVDGRVRPPYTVSLRASNSPDTQHKHGASAKCAKAASARESSFSALLAPVQDADFSCLQGFMFQTSRSTGA